MQTHAETEEHGEGMAVLTVVDGHAVREVVAIRAHRAAPAHVHVGWAGSARAVSSLAPRPRLAVVAATSGRGGQRSACVTTWADGREGTVRGGRETAAPVRGSFRSWPADAVRACSACKGRAFLICL